MRKFCDCFISYWRCASAKKRVWLYIGIYTLAFLAAFLIAWSPFLLEGKSFVWQIDGRWHHFPTLVYVGRTLRRILLGLATGNFSIPLFDVSMGLGDDVIGSLNMPGGTDPLLLLSAFVPTRYSEHLYAFLTVFKVYLAGLSFSYLCYYFGKRASHTMIGSMVYCFSGYAAFCSMRHPFFINPMFLLPLLIVGADKILKKGIPYFFIMSLAYTALCSFYHVYMMTVMVFLYAAVRFFDIYKENRVKEFLLALGRGIAGYLLGLGLGAAVFVPTVMEFLNSARAGHNHYSAYSWIFQLVRFIKLIVPPGNWEDLAFASIVIFAAVLLLFSKQRRTLKILTVMTIATLLTSFGGYVMNGFQYPSNRWSFGLALTASYATVEMLPELLNPSRKQRLICLAVLAAYATYFFVTKFGRNFKYLHVGVIFLTLTFLALTMTLHEAGKKTERGGGGLESYGCARELICLALVVINVGVNGLYLFAADQGGYSKEFQKRGVEVSRLQGSAVRELEPYLLGTPQGRGDGTGFIVNEGMVWQIPTMLFYSPMTNRNIVEFWDKIENCGRNQYFMSYSTDQRTIVNTLLTGRYQVEGVKRTAYVPYGYSEIKRTKKGNVVYENDYALPWGYTYEKAVPYETLEGMNGIAKQEAMLQVIALDQESASAGAAELSFDEKRLPYAAGFANCEWKDGRLTVRRPNATLTLNFQMPENVEGYVRLRGFDINGSGAGLFFNVWLKCGDIVKRAQAHSNLDVMYDGRENYLFNLGYSAKERHNVTLTFPRLGTFKLKDIELYALPMTNYPARVNALRAEPMKNIQWGINELSGSVDLSKDKILCLSVPYSKGWSATVDGQEAEILRGNYMFMALPLKAGHHDIVFSYCTPGLKLGAVLTLISGCIVVGMLWQDRRRRAISLMS